MTYDYTIAKTPSESVFIKQRERLKRNNFIKMEELVDVDGSIIDIHQNAEGKRIKLFLDYEIGAVYIQSSQPCEQFLIIEPIHTYIK